MCHRYSENIYGILMFFNVIFISCLSLLKYYDGYKVLGLIAREGTDENLINDAVTVSHKQDPGTHL